MENFSPVEYLTVLSSIIFGLVVSEYFYGWGTLRASRLKRIHLTFLFWTLFQLLFVINVWWGSWVRTDLLAENIGYYFLSLTTPVLLYMISVVTFPESTKIPSVDIYHYFSKRFTKIMFIYFLVMLSILANTVFFNPLPFIRLEVLLMFIGALLALTATIASSKKSQTIVLVICWALLLVHIILIETPFPENHYSSFTQNEYLSIFIGIICGYVATVFFLGWGRLIRNFSFKQIEIPHLLWTILAFLILIDYWWSSWNKMDFVNQNLGFFLLSIFPLCLYYFLAISLFSVLSKEKSETQIHFKLASPTIFILFACVLSTNAFSSIVFGETVPTDSKNIFRVMGAIFALIAAYKNTRLIQNMVLGVGWILYIAHLIRDEFWSYFV